MGQRGRIPRTHSRPVHEVWRRVSPSSSSSPPRLVFAVLHRVLYRVHHLKLKRAATHRTRRHASLQAVSIRLGRREGRHVGSGEMTPIGGRGGGGGPTPTGEWQRVLARRVAGATKEWCGGIRGGHRRVWDRRRGGHGVRQRSFGKGKGNAVIVRATAVLAQTRRSPPHHCGGSDRDESLLPSCTRRMQRRRGGDLHCMHPECGGGERRNGGVRRTGGQERRAKMGRAAERRLLGEKWRRRGGQRGSCRGGRGRVAMRRRGWWGGVCHGSVYGGGGGRYPPASTIASLSSPCRRRLECGSGRRRIWMGERRTFRGAEIFGTIHHKRKGFVIRQHGANANESRTHALGMVGEWRRVCLCEWLLMWECFCVMLFARSNGKVGVPTQKIKIKELQVVFFLFDVFFFFFNFAP